ncbi:MAG: RibD family protein [Fimbriimonadaceae bacterium]|nr:MAG: RibD family protein [Fimbriimonadaceae bacterium]
MYEGLSFPDPPADRPYVFLNMVTTMDGKILTGPRDEHVMDLGSAVDHATMRFLEGQADAVMIGAGSLRATPGLWYGGHLYRFVVSGSGVVPETGRFFTDAPDKAFIVTPAGRGQGRENRIESPGATVDFNALLNQMVGRFGIRRLLVEGGSELNASLFESDLIDDVFWTVAPKVKLGRDVPTMADGDPLPGRQTLAFRLVESHVVGDELFLRYRRDREAADGG